MDFKPMPTSLLASMAELAARRLESGDVPGTDQAMRDLFDPHMHSHLGCGGRVRSQTLRYSRVDIPTAAKSTAVPCLDQEDAEWHRLRFGDGPLTRH
jgi:hypothetical protein